MKTARIILSLLLIVTVAASFNGCKKKEEPKDYQSQTFIANENGISEKVYDDAKLFSDQMMSLTGGLKSSEMDTVYMGQCILATLDWTASPILLTIDFGSSNCLCTDGFYRRGKIIVTFTGGYFDPGTVITYGFEDYYVNDYHVMGTKTVTNMGPNNSGNLWWDIVVDGQIVEPNNGSTFFWSSNHQLEWSEGATTPGIWWDDVYLVRGSASGTTVEGLDYTMTIVTDLVKKLNCQWVVSGVLNIQPEGWPLFVVDYGDGTCDNQATVTVNGEVYYITM
jgi:hypothetical protein